MSRTWRCSTSFAQDFAIRAGDRLRIVKSSVEHLEILAHEGPFDAATALNVFYAVDDVLACLKSLNRILKMGGSLVFTTTDSETRLRPLLTDIYENLSREADFAQLAPHVKRVDALNMELERTGKTTRYTKDDYLKWVREAGFEVEPPCPRLYMDAVILVRSKKVRELSPEAPEPAALRSSCRSPPRRSGRGSPEAEPASRRGAWHGILGSRPTPDLT